MPKNLMTIADVAKELNISVQAVWKSLHRHGIQPEYLTPKLAVLTKDQFFALRRMRKSKSRN